MSLGFSVYTRVHERSGTRLRAIQNNNNSAIDFFELRVKNI